MAASFVDSNTADVAGCLNARTSLDMWNIASEDVLTNLMNDYFVMRPISNSDDDTELSDDDVDINPDVDTAGNSDSSDDDGTTADCPAMFLADEIMPRDRGDVPETVQDVTIKCSCKLNNGQPCHARYAPSELADIHLQYLAMTRRDIAVLAKLSCGMHLSSMTRKTERSAARTASTANWFLHAWFPYLPGHLQTAHVISQDKLTALIAHYKVAGVEARVHRSKSKRQTPSSFLAALQDTGKLT